MSDANAGEFHVSLCGAPATPPRQYVLTHSLRFGLTSCLPACFQRPTDLMSLAFFL
ncbi:hypothetical protein BDW22DRAFT_1363707 [Trametopsis cervina]|nr:hypothetical protein BDW22DRAFT_1363707 [Trametopsis cervina]